MSDQTAQVLVEASWEVANKVGGIYTVVRGHARLLDEHYDQYLAVGPLFAHNQSKEFLEEPAPAHIRSAINRLREHGISGVFGHWDIPGRPSAVLLDASRAHFDVNKIKGLLYEEYGIDSLRSGYDFDEPLAWSWAVGMFVECLREEVGSQVVAHLHEWMSGFAALYLKLNDADVGTVFTTHATMLGRTISASTDISLYDELESLDTMQLASQLGVLDKHTAEVACATHANVFTTVSDITGLEASKLLGVEADVILYNGIDTDSYPSFDEARDIHQSSRERIRDFLEYFFFTHYSFNLDDSLIFFTSGRYEFKNKGLDVFSQALGRLNQWMQEQGISTTIIVFYWVPGETHGIRNSVLEARNSFARMKSIISEHSDQLVRRVLRNAQALSGLSCEQLFDTNTRDQLQELAECLDTGGTPALCTHNLPSEKDDAIIRSFYENNLRNQESDRVKVVLHPVYLDGSDGLLDLTYDQAIAGAHLGVFASYYEPWGYTPVEAAGFGVPSVTSDLGGFGRFIREEADKGVFVLSRMNHSHDEVVDELFGVMKHYVELSKEDRLAHKRFAKQLTDRTKWETFIKYYLQAHTEAYDKN